MKNSTIKLQNLLDKKQKLKKSKSCVTDILTINRGRFLSDIKVIIGITNERQFMLSEDKKFSNPERVLSAMNVSNVVARDWLLWCMTSSSARIIDLFVDKWMFTRVL